MTKNAFNLEARNKYLELLSEFVTIAMNDHGYKETMEMKRPDNPQIWEFNNKGKIVVMTITPHEGALSGESTIRIEPEKDTDMDEILEIIGDAIALLVENVSKRVFKALSSKESKKIVLDTIKKRIADFSKDL